ncbi:MAG: peptide chain release factor N(5)-glutamine methyltransferase [Parvibaculum sp.]|nr:peptide chain release factor N(5)-glutamine methyltransferase [Parvibaculum sp.]
MMTLTMLTRDHAYRMLAWRFKEGGIDNASLDARLLVQAACACNEIDMIREPGKRISGTEESLLAQFEERRLKGEPVSRILGRREFWGLDFLIGPHTLDPRPDSEILVEVALTLLPVDKKVTILDLGTGSGCLLIALLHERKQATGIGNDLDMETLNLAQENALTARVADRATFRHGRWAEGINERFNLVISNPPYIRAADIALLSPEVRDFDPVLALSGGADGLTAYRELAQVLPALLLPLGHAVIELGAGQGGDVTALFEGAGLEVLTIANDLGGVPRALVARLPRP